MLQAAAGTPAMQAPAMANMQVAAPAMNTLAVVVRQRERQISIVPARRTTGFVASQANAFADVLKAELLYAALRAGVDVAQQKIYETAVNKAAGRLSSSAAGVVGSVSNHVKLWGRGRKQHGFEFDYVPGLRAAAELSSETPIEFVISGAAGLPQFEPVIVRAKAVEKNSIRVLASRKIEQKEGAGGLQDRSVLNSEVDQPVHVESVRNADGSVLVRTAAAAVPGEYALVLRRPDAGGFAVLETVYDFRVK